MILSKLAMPETRDSIRLLFEEAIRKQGWDSAVPSSVRNDVVSLFALDQEEDLVVITSREEGLVAVQYRSRQIILAAANALGAACTIPNGLLASFLFLLLLANFGKSVRDAVKKLLPTDALVLWQIVTVDRDEVDRDELKRSFETDTKEFLGRRADEGEFASSLDRLAEQDVVAIEGTKVRLREYCHVRFW